MKVVVLFSGGIDSMAVAHFYQQAGYDIVTMFFDYGQMAKNAECFHADKVANYMGLCFKPYKSVDLSIISDGEIAGRNALLVLQAFAIQKYGIYKIALGIHDGTDYPDCSMLFVEKINALLDLYTGGTVICEAPFVKFCKHEIIEYAKQNSLPIELTYSCEKGVMPPCGECLSCLDRKVL
jgi:7-cyano-7-deazaguanine synthase